MVIDNNIFFILILDMYLNIIACIEYVAVADEAMTILIICYQVACAQ